VLSLGGQCFVDKTDTRCLTTYLLIDRLNPCGIFRLCQFQIVMLGGVVSALVVGAILENGNLYANIAAESYIQSGGDAEFWKNLSEEEKKMAQGMLSKIKEAKEGGGISEEDLSKVVLETIGKEAEGGPPVNPPKREQPRKEVAQATSDVFNDYD
jgi:hypothetical protein